MGMESFRQYCLEKISEMPARKMEITELFDLASAEINSGESEDHEIELAMSDIEAMSNDIEPGMG